MGTTEKGTQYEIFVHKVYQAILQAELLGTVKNIRVEHDVKLEDRFGQNRQVDVYWEYSLGGIIHKVGVECRNYNSSIPVEKIDAFATKVQDLRLSKGIMVSVKGFQSGAVSKAEHHGISLIEMREITDEDFEGYLQIINIQIHALLPPRIVEFKPEVNRAWIEKNYSDQPKGGQISLQMSGRNDQMFIVDRAKDERISLLDFESSLAALQAIPGKYEETFYYDDACLAWDARTVDIDSLWVSYVIPEPMELGVQIDYKKEFLAIMEYVTCESKKVGVLRDGSQKEF